MRKKLLLALAIMCTSMLLFTSFGSNTKDVSNMNKIPNPWVDVNDINQIYKQLGGKFEINPPKGFKVEYMAMGLQSLIDDGTIKPSGKITSVNDNKAITVQIMKSLDLFNYARINYECVAKSSIHAFYDIDTKRIVYAQGDYTILIDIEGMEQDFSLVEMVKLIK